MQTDVLANLVSQKREVLLHLRQLGLRQVELTGGSDWSQLSKVLSTKERLLSLLVSVEAKLEPYRAQEPAMRVWPSPEAREACRAAAEHCAELLAEVMRLEKQSEEAMVRRRDAAAERLAGMHTGGAVHAAYLSEAPSSLGFNLVSES